MCVCGGGSCWVLQVRDIMDTWGPMCGVTGMVHERTQAMV